MVPLILAHPLTEPGGLGVPPAFVAGVAVAAVVAVGRLLPVGAGSGTNDVDAQATAAPELPRTRTLAVVTRTVGTGLLVLAILAGRLGDPDQLDNLTPALVVGFGWPALLIATLVVGDVWRWLNPFDTLARGLAVLSGQRAAAPDGGPPHGSRWWALPTAAVWTWWLVLYPRALEPRDLGAFLGLYTIATLIACLLLGRQRWLVHGEVVTVTLDAIARGRRTSRFRGAVDWPPDTDVVLGVLGGGLLFGLLRFSTWWIGQLDDLGVDPLGVAAVYSGFAVSLLLGGAAARGASRWARRLGTPAATVATALSLTVAGIGIALGLARDRLWTSAQLIVLRASNPFGGDADLFGTADGSILLWPFGVEGRVAAQVTVLVATGLLAILAARRRAGGRQDAVLVSVGGWLGLALLAVSAV